MSYDFSIDAPSGESVEPLFNDTLPAFESDGIAGNVVLTAKGYTRCGNYTSNVSPMWARCLTAALQDVPQAKHYAHDDGKRLCLADLAGQKGWVIAPVLQRAVEWGVEHIDELRKMNPSNGWGNAEGAITYLWDIQRMCEAHPDGTLYISR